MPHPRSNPRAAQNHSDFVDWSQTHCIFFVLSVSFVAPFLKSGISVSLRCLRTSMRYLHYDVFTSTPLEGNQLAVYPEPPPDIAASRMQRIAAEMNFSETTF